MEKYIAFVGDSFCAFTNGDSNVHGTIQGKVSTPAYTSIVTDHYGYQQALFGFCGRSWWYSWDRFFNVWGNRLSQIEAIIFCHTDSNRINNSIDNDLPHIANENVFAWYQTDTQEACKTYYRYILDEKFNSWAQQQYFKMLKEQLGDIKTIHFHCFHNSVPYSDLLPGVVFTTPLMEITVGEIAGTKKHILKALSGIDHVNHMNPHNNKALAKVIIDTLDNYEPGQYPIPLEGFDQPNPNAKNYPSGTNFWTE